MPYENIVFWDLVSLAMLMRIKKIPDRKKNKNTGIDEALWKVIYRDLVVSIIDNTLWSIVFYYPYFSSF